jgi:DNA-binding transcriptional regulator YhcF (GntR family)
MHFILDKQHKSTLFEQAREQLLTALHMSKLRPGDRLPSVRQVAQRNSINLKTAFAIYQRLGQEGYVELRSGSGAYVADREKVDLDQAYSLAILRLIKSSLSQAGHLKLDHQRYSDLVQNFVRRARLSPARLAVIECNEEQVNLFAREIMDRLKVQAHPLLLEQMESPDQRTARLLAGLDYFVTTDFHFKRVEELAATYNAKILKLRLDPTFVPGLVAAARRGGVLMIVSNTSFFSAFRHSLTNIGIKPATLDNITAVDDSNIARVRAAALRSRWVYISPICNPRVRKAIPKRVGELKFESMLSQESIETLEAAVLFHS